MLQGCITFSPSPSLWAVSRWREITRDGGFPVFLLFLSLHTLFLCFLFLFFISATVAFLSSFHLFFFPWHCELPLCVTVTWASASPHITAAFDWLGLSRSVSCCLIITLFDCWSRDVIDWSAHPVWGCASEEALCVGVYWSRGGGGDCCTGF